MTMAQSLIKQINWYDQQEVIFTQSSANLNYI